MLDHRATSRELRAITQRNFVSTRLEVATRLMILTGYNGGIGRSSVMNLAARKVNVVFTYGSK